MLVELFLKLTVAVFSVFGLYAFAKALEETLFRSDKICVTVKVDSSDVARQIEFYLKEAKNALFVRKSRTILVIIIEELADNELIDFLKKRNIRYHIVAK